MTPDELAEGDDAYTVESVDAAPAELSIGECTKSELSLGNKCAGPWEYERYKTCERTYCKSGICRNYLPPVPSHCPNKQCTPSMCTSTSQQSRNGTGSRFSLPYYVFDWCGTSGSRYCHLVRVNDLEARNRCSAQANAFAREIENEWTFTSYNKNVRVTRVTATRVAGAASFRHLDSRRLNWGAAVGSATYSCSYTVSYERVFSTACVSTTCTCNGRLPECGAETYYGDAGRAANPPISAEAPAGAAPVCTTGDHLPFAKSAEDGNPVATPAELQGARALFSHLERYQSVAAARSHLSVFYRRMKVLYEKYSEGLTQHQRDVAMSLYRSPAVPDPICGSQASRSCPATDNSWLWNYCARLTGSHVDPRLIGNTNGYGQFDGDGALCYELIELALAAGADEACATGEQQAIFAALIDKLGDLPSGNGASSVSVPGVSQDGLAAQLAFVQRAYDHAEATGSLTPAELHKRLESMLATVWQTIERRAGDDPANIDQSARLIDKIEARVGYGLKLDALVLLTLYPASGNGPLRNEALVAATAEALAATVQRLETISEYHDLGCLLGGCEVDTAPEGQRVFARTPVSDTWAALAGLLDQETLGRWTADNDNLGPGLSVALRRLHARHAMLTGAIAETTGWLSSEAGGLAKRNWSELDASAQFPHAPLVQRLLSLVAKAQSRAANYARTGQLYPDASARLLTTVEFDRRKAVFNDPFFGATRLLADLATDIQSYEQGVVALVQAQLQANAATASRDALRVRRDDLVDRIDDLRAQQSAHAKAASQANDSFGLLASEPVSSDGVAELFSAIEDSLGDEQVSVGPLFPQPLALGANAARFSGRRSSIGDLTELTPIAVDAGEMAILQVSGQWSPTCALRRSSLLNEDGSVSGVKFAEDGALAGPEGFMLGRQGDEYVAASDSYAKTRNVNVGVSAETCAGSPSIAEGAWGVSAKACAYARYDEGWGWSDTEDEGSRTSTSLSLTAGLRLRNTPFPAAPVGSLLVVELPSGATSLSRVRDVHLVRSGLNHIATNGASDLYLVANDVAGCAAAPQEQRLSVEGRLVASERDLSRNLLGRISSVVALLRAQRARFVDQGELLGTELEALRAWSRLATLTTAGHSFAPAEGDDYNQPPSYPTVDLSEYPEPLRELYDAIVSRELVALERAVRIKTLAREIRSMAAELRAIDIELANAETTSQLTALLPRLSLRNADGAHLERKVADLAAYARTYMFPIMTTWYPEALASIRADKSSAANRLANVDLYDTTLDELAELVRATVASAEQTYNRYVGLNGDVPVANAPETRLVILSLEGARGPFRNSIHREHPDAPEFWEAVRAAGANETAEKRTFELSLRPEDVYADDTQGQIGCRRELPVVRRAALAVVTPNFNPRVTKIANMTSARPGQAQQYARHDGLVDFTFENDRRNAIEFHIMRTPQPAEVENWFRTSADTLSWGVSPFMVSTLTFEPGAILSELQRAFEVLLVLEVETTPAPYEMAWIRTCDD